jgi:ATP/maltotriose-dependent transcriptional regulator MalT
LKNRLEKADQALRQELYRNAGEWYRENGLIREAIEVFIKAGAYEQAFPLLLDTDFYLSMVQNGEFSAWNAWMSKIPEQYYEGEVRACTGYSWALSMGNRIREAVIWAERAQICFDRIKDQLSPAEKDFLEANVIMTKVNIALFEMDLKQLRDYLQQADRIELGRQIVVGEMNSGEVSILKTI